MTFFSENTSSKKENKNAEDMLLIEIENNEFETHAKNNINFYAIFGIIFIIATFATLILIPSFLSKEHTQTMGVYKTHSSPELKAEMIEKQESKKRENKQEIIKIQAIYN